jgi:hypothetical protein
VVVHQRVPARGQGDVPNLKGLNPHPNPDSPPDPRRTAKLTLTRTLVRLLGGGRGARSEVIPRDEGSNVRPELGLPDTNRQRRFESLHDRQVAVTSWTLAWIDGSSGLWIADSGTLWRAVSTAFFGSNASWNTPKNRWMAAGSPSPQP